MSTSLFSIVPITIIINGWFEKKHGLPPGTFRNSNGRDTRSDKRIGTIRKEHSENKKG